MAILSPVKGYTFDDVLLEPKYSEINSRDQVDISVQIFPNLRLKVPIMSANMQTVNSVKLCIAIDKEGGIATVDQFRNINKQVEMINEIKKAGAKVGGAIGVTKDYLERATSLIESDTDFIVMDTPHAHNNLTKNAILNFQRNFNDFPLIVGNIATKDATKFLMDLGIKCIKVGIGPGAACLTRENTGVGGAQLTAIMECFEVAKEYEVKLIADGGIKMPGSFSKAIAAGGCCVYMGSIFAGTDEAPSNFIERDGIKYKQYFGSSSSDAKIKRTIDDESFLEDVNRFVEGGSGYTLYRGSVEKVIKEYIMGLKSAMSYVGAINISEFQKRSTFRVITNNGVLENGAHGLNIQK